jgi:hypothetical protein
MLPMPAMPAILTGLVLTLAVTLVPILSVGEARAAGSVTASVSRSVSSRVVLTGDEVRIAGRVSRAVAGSVTRLQRRQGHRWVTLRGGHLGVDGRYAFTFSSRVGGSWRFRVMSGGGRAAAVSRTFSVKVLRCAHGARPSSTAAWFTRPGRRGLDPVAARLSQLFCSAAPRSTIDIAMYYIRAVGRQPDVNPMLASLRRVARYRHVRVRVILEGRLYARSDTLRASLRPLRRFAKVIRCHRGCHNDRSGKNPGRGTMHHKFITISDTSWSRTKDPAVVLSSANWSQTQLANAWQSAVLVYNDDQLYREFHVQFETLATCATGCGHWAHRLRQLRLSPATYGLTRVRGLWRDVDRTERRGASGSGRGVVFSPWAGRDPLATALRGYTCNRAHHTVLVGHMFLTGVRQPVIDALAGLARGGCRVRVILSQLSNNQVGDGIRKARRSGLTVGCVPRLHDKMVLVNAVRRADGRPDRSLWMGSQSLGGRALRDNDEAMLRVSTADASGRARLANASLFSRFARDWRTLDRHRRGC